MFCASPGAAAERIAMKRYRSTCSLKEPGKKRPRVRFREALDLVHVLEDVLALDDDLHAQLLADGEQALLHRVEVGLFHV